MCIRTLLGAAIVAATAVCGNAAESTLDFKRVPYGNIPAAQPMVTNVDEVVAAMEKKVDNKADNFILGKNLSASTEYYKLTPSATDSEGGSNRYPYLPFVYSSTTNNPLNAVLYDSKLNRIPGISSTEDGVGSYMTVDADTGAIRLEFKVNGNQISCPVDTIETVVGKVIDAEIEDPTTYGYSNPHDWKVRWQALDDYDEATAVSEEQSTNRVGQVYTTTKSETLTNGKAELYISYLDEVNAPDFGNITYEVVSGDATIDNNVLTANASGVVKVKATTDIGTVRNVDVSLYQNKREATYSRYTTDLLASRKRVNDYHYNMLLNYRSNPTTNRVYSTWNEPQYVRHIGYNGDQFRGQYGKHFFPYQHMTSQSGGSGWWSHHGVISKHVLLAANHYGDWNHSRARNMKTYLNWDGKFSGQCPIRLIKYVNLNTWATENGFEGTDTAMGDLGVYVISTAEFDGGANNGIPDECLPYLATADYLNSTYGIHSAIMSTNSSGIATYEIEKSSLCCISFNQSATIGLRRTSGPTWSDYYNPYSEGTMDFSDDPVTSDYFREDIAKLARRCGWHNVVMGDSGQPIFIYDPALTTGLTHDFGEGAGAEPLLRPILISCYTTPGSGPSVARCLKVLKAFCASVGDELPYVLGDPDTQSTDNDVIRDNAIEATKHLSW